MNLNNTVDQAMIFLLLKTGVCVPTGIFHIIFQKKKSSI